MFYNRCPKCGQELKLQDEWIGMTMSCPSCNNNFVVEKNTKTEIPVQENSLPQVSLLNATQRNKKRLFFTVTLSFLLIAVISGGIVAYVSHSPNSEKQEQYSVQTQEPKPQAQDSVHIQEPEQQEQEQDSEQPQEPEQQEQ